VFEVAEHVTLLTFRTFVSILLKLLACRLGDDWASALTTTTLDKLSVLTDKRRPVEVRDRIVHDKQSVISLLI
jgi:hypothetical protein